jgi:hypothetical protein
MVINVQRYENLIEHLSRIFMLHSKRVDVGQLMHISWYLCDRESAFQSKTDYVVQLYEKEITANFAAAAFAK